ncbi:MAG: sodium:solute symporter family protein [Pseudomonadota bacterium]
MNTFVIGMIISILVYLGVGWYAGRKIKHLDDYYVAGRNAPTFLIVGTLVASFLSTNAFIGEVGMSYRGHGPLIVIMTGVNCCGYIIGALFFGRFLRRAKTITVPEFFGQRFNSRRLQVLAGLTIVVGLSCYLLAVTWGVSLVINQVTGISYTAAILIAWFGYTAFTMYSGSQGVILTDTIMFTLFVSVALVALYFIVDAGGGWFASVQQLAVYEAKPGIISWHGVVGDNSNWQTPTDGLIWALILGVAWGIVVAVSPWQTSRYLMAKSEHVVIRSACGAAIAMFLLYLVTTFGAAAINLSNPDIDPAESAMIWAAMNLMPSVAGAILVSGIIAAGLSSASTFLSLIGFSATNDVLNTDHDAKPQQLSLTRYLMVGISLLVLISALTLPNNIFWITYFAGPVFASSWGVVAFMSVWSSRITEAAAFWGMLAGFFGNIAFNLLALVADIKLPVYLDPILVGGVISLITVLVVSSASSVSKEEHAYREALHTTPIEELDQQQFALTLRWPKAMVIVGFLMVLAITYFYALPYQEALDGIKSVQAQP